MDDSNRIEEQENEMESGTALIPSVRHWYRVPLQH